MIFYRRNSFSDKVIAFLCFMMMMVIGYNTYVTYTLDGKVFAMDIILAIACLGMGILFIGSYRFKYLKITPDSVTWYTWFVIKHTLKKTEIKEVCTRKRYLILVKQRGEVWISNNYIRHDDDEKVRELLKTFNRGN